ncbi:MAG: septation protein IspZ [Pantoea sp. Brub]|nr:septation protein IspZ [Pantoea sp. Brub]
MKLFLEIFPLITFFIFYKIYNIFIASKILIFASSLVLLINWLIDKKIKKIYLINFSLVTVFSLMTIHFHSNLFIKWKITFIYIIFAMVLLFNHFFSDRLLIQKMLGKNLKISHNIWKKLNVSWIIFLLFCGLTNTLVASYLSEELWVYFKVFGLTSLTLVFVIFNIIYTWKKNNC